MFCPKCATQHVEGAKFCRSCGANISLIPHALSGQLPTVPANEAIERAFRRKRRKEPSLAEGSRLLMMGIAFVVVSILVGKYSPGGWHWWYWMLIPAATFLGKGISEIVRARQAKTAPPTFAQPQMSAGIRPPSLPVRVGGHDYRVHLDTGAPFALALPTKYKDEVPVEGPLGEGKARTPAGEFQTYKGILKSEAEIGAYKIPGRAIFFTRATHDGWQLMRIPTEGGKPEFTGLAGKGNNTNIDLNADGSRIAFNDFVSGANAELWDLDNLTSVLKAAR